MENEITQELQLTDEQSSLLDMHSFLNVMNVLTGELTVLNFQTPDRKGLDEAIELAFAISRNLSNMPEALKHAEKVREYRKLILDRITDNFPPRQTPPDVNESIDEQFVKMPPVFQDVMRDLIANARKYTLPGGKINAGFSDDGKMLRFVVEDNGKGIPEDQITQVVNFGERGNNISDIRTMGEGFGLTKAYFVTKQFNGRMWIKSNPGDGTQIKIHIPRDY